MQGILTVHTVDSKSFSIPIYCYENENSVSLLNIKKCYTKLYYNELVTQVNQHQQCVRDADRQANATINNVHTIHK